MLTRTRLKLPTDINERAHAVVNHVTGARLLKPEPDPDAGKDPAAVALGRKGGKKGGKASAASMTPEQRTERARKAAAARWGKTGEDQKDGE